jgi:hypothetical protein
MLRAAVAMALGHHPVCCEWPALCDRASGQSPAAKMPGTLLSGRHSPHSAVDGEPACSARACAGFYANTGHDEIRFSLPPPASVTYAASVRSPWSRVEDDAVLLVQRTHEIAHLRPRMRSMGRSSEQPHAPDTARV